MTNRNQWCRIAALPAILACLATFSVGAASAQEKTGQGKYVVQASARLAKLIGAANGAGFKMREDGFAIGGGWLKQGEKNWVALYTINLEPGKQYRFLAAGDDDARDVDLQLLDPNGKTVGEDEETDAAAVVDYEPRAAGRYLVRVRLYASQQNLPAACLAIALER